MDSYLSQKKSRNILESMPLTPDLKISDVTTSLDQNFLMLHFFPPKTSLSPIKLLHKTRIRRKLFFITTQVFETALKKKKVNGGRFIYYCLSCFNIKNHSQVFSQICQRKIFLVFSSLLICQSTQEPVPIPMKI